MYHRVAEHVPDVPTLCVSRAHFAEHLEYLRSTYKVISLRQLTHSLKTGKIPQKAVVLTFDDGYVDNLWHAKPLLKKYDCPATIFVSSGYVGQDRELLTDELDRMLLQSPQLPSKLVLRIAGQEHRWEFDDSPAQLMAWNFGAKHDPSPRHRCVRDLHRLLRPLSQMQRNEAFDFLASWACSSRKARSDRRVMTAAELKELSQDSLVEIGGHTVSHLVLASQPLEIQRREIVEGKKQLEQIINKPVTSFAYPYGGANDFTEQTVQLVHEANFTSACSTLPGTVLRQSDMLALPRIMVPDWDGEEFSQQLDRAFCD